ncbi:MAG: hypothetical protein V1887_02700 [Candidatus Aenigmatarchaeota archaeon]
MQNLRQKLVRRLAFFLPFMVLGLLTGMSDTPFASSRLLSITMSLIILWLLSRQLTDDYEPETAGPIHKAVISLLAGFTLSMFWADTAWFPEGSALLAGFPVGSQMMIVGAVSLGLALAIWYVFSKCIEAFFGDVIDQLKAEYARKGTKR